MIADRETIGPLIPGIGRRRPYHGGRPVAGQGTVQSIVKDGVDPAFRSPGQFDCGADIHILVQSLILAVATLAK